MAETVTRIQLTQITHMHLTKNGDYKMNREQLISAEHSGPSTTDCKNSLSRGGGDLPRRKFLALVGGALSFPALLRAAGKGTPPKPQNVLSPDEALNRLVIGNYRYVDGNMRHHDFNAERAALVLGQNPFAGVLSCADSRVAPE